MQKVIVQILRAPIGGIRKHVLDILDDVSSSDMRQIFITNMTDTDVDLSYLRNNKNIELFHVDIFEAPGLQDLRNIIQIYKILKNKNVNVVHGHGAKGGLYARALAKLLGARCIYTPHGGSLHRVHGKLKNFLYDIIEKMMVPLTDLFLFESQYSKKVFAKNIANPGQKFLVNYNGVDFNIEPSQQLYQKGHKLRLASFGLLRELKGHDIFIRACGIINQEHIPFEYVIYGNGDFEAYLVSLIKELHLEGMVKIEKYSKDVYEKMKTYDFIVHPSRFESFGYVPVEAASLKVPVISSNEGGLEEVVRPEYGFIANHNTPEEYASILRSLYAGDGNLKDKVETAYAYTQTHFSKKTMISKLKEIYQS